MNHKYMMQRYIQILDFIVDFKKEHGYPPTIREIGKGVEIKSASLVSYYLNNMEKYNLIEREPFTSRGIRVLYQG